MANYKFQEIGVFHLRHVSLLDQYGLKGAHFIPVNMYGPNDHFDLENSHVIPALIRKFSEAVVNNQTKVHCWGTGEAYREFLFVYFLVFFPRVFHFQNL